MTPTRIFDIPLYQLQHSPLKDALASKEAGEWRAVSTQMVVDTVNKVSKGLIGMGVKPGEKIGLISSNRPEWNYIDFGMMQVGAINIPLFPTIGDPDLLFVLNEAEVKYIFAGDKILYQRLKALQPQAPLLKEIFTFDRLPGARHWSDVTETGKGIAQSRVDEIANAIKPHELATIIYTSGTSGFPKGVMLSHANIVSNIENCLPILMQVKPERAISFLPLNHIFERMVAYIWMRAGVSIYYAEGLEKIADNIKEIHPHIFTAVPRLLEKVYEGIMKKGGELTGIKKELFDWAVRLGLEFDDEWDNSAWYNFKLSIARKLIFSKWQAALGGELKAIVTGGAALQPRLARLFTAAGIITLQGYGLTETSPVVAVNHFVKGSTKIGTIGPPIPGEEVRLAEDGEIMVRGENVMMGYFKHPELTAEVMTPNGFFMTGDIGEWVSNKYLKITDRKKELFKNSGGKYVAPGLVENKLKEIIFIEQVMVVGANKKFAAALIVPNVKAMRDWGTKNKIPYQTTGEISGSAEFNKMLKDEIAKINKQLNAYEQVKKFRVLTSEWTIERGELTPKGSLRRKTILENYSAIIDDIYKQELDI